MTRHYDVATSAPVAQALPGLAVLAGRIGDLEVCKRGAIGRSAAKNVATLT